MKIALVGATGMVGGVMLKVIAERKFPLTDLILVASHKSVGKSVSWQGQEYVVQSLDQAIALKPDIALFSAGGACSLDWAPKFAAVGTTVIDNSSAWRMKQGHKLIVPEINASELNADDKIIANPNCSTIQMVMALAPLHKLYGLERLVIQPINLLQAQELWQRSNWKTRQMEPNRRWLILIQFTKTVCPTATIFCLLAIPEKR